jgi:hypothetical protein
MTPKAAYVHIAIWPVGGRLYRFTFTHSFNSDYFGRSVWIFISMAIPVVQLPI